MSADAGVVGAILGTLGVIITGLLAYAAKKTEARSNHQAAGESSGAQMLADAVREWRAIAEDARATADEAKRTAESAHQQTARHEGDIVALMAYMREMWAGFIGGTVPPHPPIPEALRHRIGPEDFPWGGSGGHPTD